MIQSVPAGNFHQFDLEFVRCRARPVNIHHKGLLLGLTKEKITLPKV